MIDKQGHILTNYHVVENAESVQVTLFDGTTHDAQVIGTDASNDVAVVRVSAPADRLRSILDLVQDSLDEQSITGEDLAARAHLSRFHFDRLVSAALGEAPGAFRRRLLLERAAHQLVSTSLTVTRIGAEAGLSLR